MVFFHKKTVILSLIIVCCSCSSIRHVVPLESGQSRVSASLGGPITKIGDNFYPVPFLTLGYNYGIEHNLDLEAGVNFTDLFFGVTAIDAGINWHPLQQYRFRPGLYVSLKGTFTTQFKKETSRIFPQIDFGGYWHPSKRQYLYVGMETWIEFHSERYDGNNQKNHLLLNPYLGYIFKQRAWMFQVEGRAFTVNLSNTARAPKNIGFGDRGILGLFIGMSRDFGGTK